MSCGISSNLKTSSKILDKSSPSSIFDLFSISPPSRTFLNFLLDSLIFRFFAILGSNSENIGIIKAIRTIKKLESPVKYRVLNFSNPKLNEFFFLKLFLAKIKTFEALETDLR